MLSWFSKLFKQAQKVEEAKVSVTTEVVYLVSLTWVGHLDYFFKVYSTTKASVAVAIQEYLANKYIKNSSVKIQINQVKVHTEYNEKELQ